MLLIPPLPFHNYVKATTKLRPHNRWRLSIWHVPRVPTFYDGVTVDISMEGCDMAMALQIFRIQIALSGLVLLGWWWCQEWKDDERDTPVVLGVVVVGCRNVVSGVSRRVSGVDIRHYSACALCMMPIILEAKLHAAFHVFLQSKKQHHV